MLLGIKKDRRAKGQEGRKARLKSVTTSCLFALLPSCPSNIISRVKGGAVGRE
jgi:hypothetical protein